MTLISFYCGGRSVLWKLPLWSFNIGLDISLFGNVWLHQPESARYRLFTFFLRIVCLLFFPFSFFSALTLRCIITWRTSWFVDFGSDRSKNARRLKIIGNLNVWLHTFLNVYLVCICVKIYWTYLVNRPIILLNNLLGLSIYK